MERHNFTVLIEKDEDGILVASPEDELEIAEAKAEIEADKGIKAEDVWRELGI